MIKSIKNITDKKFTMMKCNFICDRISSVIKIPKFICDKILSVIKFLSAIKPTKNSICDGRKHTMI